MKPIEVRIADLTQEQRDYLKEEYTRTINAAAKAIEILQERLQMIDDAESRDKTDQ